jgi:NAD(P)-dependent dehydrogenase (short-subunit alcohol dehydrogenase family)
LSKVTLITGAGSGIGRAVAVGFAKAGHQLVLAGRRAHTLSVTAAIMGGSPLIVPVDVADAASVQNLFTRVRERFGRIDILFNNAGTTADPLPIDELSLEAWRKVIDTNVTGAFLCAREAFRLMKNQRPAGGRIINNGSISSVAPRPYSAAYTTSKHAITGLTKSLSLDGRQHDIACGQIDIGNAATPMTVSMERGTLQADLSVRTEPTIDAKHVADAVLYMASLPLDVNVQFITVMATKMPFIGRG